MSAIDLYAVLGVARDASTDEIRAAWKGAVADMDPTDPKLNVFNQAGAVLLDPAKREKYDATLAGDEAEDEPEDEDEADEAGHEADEAGHAEAAPTVVPAPPTPAASPVVAPSAVSRRPVPTWLLTLLAGLTVVAVLAAVFVAQPLGERLSGVRSQQRLVDAADAAEKAAVPVLSYDYRHLAQDKKAASARMTSSFRKDYDQTFTLIEQNAPAAQAVVAATVLGSAIAGNSEKGVDVLLFVDRPTSRKGAKEPVVYRDQVTFSMRLVDGEWLVDDMRTTRPA